MRRILNQARRRSRLVQGAIFAAAMLGLLNLSANSWAKTIGFNFVGGNAANALTAGESAGAPGYAQANWNNSGTPAGDWSGDYALTNLNDNTGTAVIGPQIWFGGSTDNRPIHHDFVGVNAVGPSVTANDRLMRSFVYNSSNNNNNFIQLKAIPYAKYDVVLYTNGDITSNSAANANGKYWLESPITSSPYSNSGTILTPQVYAWDAGDFNGTYTQVPLSSTDPATATTGNYIVFPNQQGPAITIRAQGATGSQAAFVNAFQLVDRSPDMIAFNFVGGSSPGTLSSSPAPSEVAGPTGLNQPNWNNLSTDWHGNGGAVPSTILNNKGAVVGTNNDVSLGLRVEYDSNTVFGNGGANTTPDERLMRGYLDDNGIGSLQPFVQLRNIPYAKYDLVVYVDGDQGAGGKDGPYWLETVTADPYSTPGTILTPQVYVNEAGNFSGTYTQVPLTSTTLLGAATGNYIVFKDLTLTDIRIRATQVTGSRAPINGFQIIQVPEAGTFSLLLCGTLAPFALRRRLRPAR